MAMAKFNNNQLILPVRPFKNELGKANIPKGIFPKMSKYEFGIMTTELIIGNERVDDIPLLVTQIEQMGVQKLIFLH